MTELRTQNVTRYIVPLREGGSLPALAEADDMFKYVVKFRGAGHGTKALVSELIGGEIARKAGLRVPELVFLNVDEEFGRTEADEEIQDLLKGSRGLNIGLHFLDGAMTLDPYANHVDEIEASKIVWLDSFLTNVDRTFRNTNMLVWHGETWLIDHGAALYFHHTWNGWEKTAITPFPYIKDHALIRRATHLDEADREMRQLITPGAITEIIDAIPTQWLEYDNGEGDAESNRSVYKEFLTRRLENSETFLKQAQDAHRLSLI